MKSANDANDGENGIDFKSYSNARNGIRMQIVIAEYPINCKISNLQLRITWICTYTQLLYAIMK